MRKRSHSFLLLRVSSFFLLASLILTTLQLIRFSRIQDNLPYGQKIAGVAVGGLDRQQAAQRLLDVYSQPVELLYDDSLIRLSPSQIDFQLDLRSMLATADKPRTQQSFMEGFRDYLWGQAISPTEIPLQYTYSQKRLREYLKHEIASRYDHLPIEAMPIVGTLSFQPGKPGRELDIEGSIPPIEKAFVSLNSRQVTLPVRETSPKRTSFQNLEVFLKQTIALSKYDGLAGVFLLDLQTSQELHFVYTQGKDIPVEPDVAFTASSIIKIPVMVSTFQRMGPEADDETQKLVEDMIDRSGNEAADWLIDRVIGHHRGPLIVTEDMQALGLKNTFLAGYFQPGSPLLQVYQTPANQRPDINTDPDPYNQTTLSDMGMLLEDIYQCAEMNGGSLMAVFPDTINQQKCQLMIDYLAQDKIGALIDAGVPDGTRVAHKHGWVSYQGLIHTVGDAGIIYTPGGNYILVLFFYHPVQIIWEPVSKLMAGISKVVYHYYNLPAP